MTLPIALQAAGSAMQGISSGLSSVFQGQVARNNALVAQQNEAYSASAGAANTEREGLKASQQLAGTRAGLAAENVDVNRGSAADVQVSQRELGALDQATVASNAALQAYGYRTQFASFEKQAHVDDVSAILDFTQAAIGAGGKIAGNLPGGSSGGTSDSGGTPDPSLLSGDSDASDMFAWMSGG